MSGNVTVKNGTTIPTKNVLPYNIIPKNPKTINWRIHGSLNVSLSTTIDLIVVRKKFKLNIEEFLQF